MPQHASFPLALVRDGVQFDECTYFQSFTRRAVFIAGRSRSLCSSPLSLDPHPPVATGPIAASSTRTLVEHSLCANAGRLTAAPYTRTPQLDRA